MNVTQDFSLARSACAKVILLGEHAVVYGRPALAVPVSGVRARAYGRLQNAGSGLSLAAPALGPAARLRGDERLTALLLAARRASFWVMEATNEPDLALSVDSDIPMARGMGSSAAVCAAIARTTAAILGTEMPADILSKLVFETESLLHGSPSGIDNTVVSHERVTWFRRGAPPLFVSIKHPLCLLIADSGQASRTKDTVAAVRHLANRQPEHVSDIIEQIGAASEAGLRALQEGDIESLGRAMDANQPLLQILGVSTDRLDTLVYAARQAGALGAKLTGGGGGGCIVALVRPNTVDNVRDALRENGAVEVYETIVQADDLRG